MAIAAAKRTEQDNHLWMDQSPAAQWIQHPNATNAAATIGTPPILGVGTLWELRSLGKSSTPKRFARRMESQTPVAAAARVAAAKTNVNNPNVCANAPSFPDIPRTLGGMESRFPYPHSCPVAVRGFLDDLQHVASLTFPAVPGSG